MERYKLKYIFISKIECSVGQGMSKLVLPQTSPLKGVIRQGQLTASPRQTPCNAFPDTAVLGCITALISAWASLGCAETASAQSWNQHCVLWENPCGAGQGQNPLPSSNPAPKPCSCQNKRDVLLTWEMQWDFCHGRQRSWGAGDVSSSLQPKTGSCGFVVKTDTPAELLANSPCFEDPGDPWVRLLVDRLSCSTSLQAEVKK